MIYSTDRLYFNSRELVIFDANIDNLQQLIDGIKPGIDWEVLNPNQDGIQQITEILANRSLVETLHIVSHGAPGCLFLGNTQLSLDTFKYYTAQLQSWFASQVCEFAPLASQVGSIAPLAPQVWGEQVSASHISQSPDFSKPPVLGVWGHKFGGKKPSILLYGCNVAAGDAGEEFIQKLHHVTQANIAASRTLTGNPQQGGNWNLEISLGSYQPRLAFNTQTEATYAGVLETNLVKDITPGSDGSNPDNLTVMGDKLFFTGFDPINGFELWVSDGTEAGTNIVKDITPGFDSSNPDNLTVMGDKLFFQASDPINGNKLWVSDGTEAGTNIVKDITSGFDSSHPDNLTVVGDQLFFTANDSSSDYELWVSDGTEAGTNLVQDINPGFDSSNFHNFTAIGDKLFFTGFDDINGTELWVSDGTEAGTNLVQDINPGSDSSYLGRFTVVGDQLFFEASDPINGTELWVSDGTEAGTNIVQDINPGSDNSSPTELTAIGDKLFFIAYDPINGFELWVSDGTEAGTNIVKDITPGFDSSNLKYLTVMGDQLFFQASDPINGSELWVSDGTEAGTNFVQDINPGSDSSFPSQLTVVGDQLFFTTYDINGSELWVSDGTEAGTNFVNDIIPGSIIPYFDFLTVVGDQLFFTANDGSNDYELWVSDGTEAGTNLVQDIRPGSISSYPDKLTAVGKKLFFTADDGSNGRELWVSDINNPPVAISIINNTIAENEAIGTVVGNFSTTDADTTDNHTYSLVAGDGDTDNAQFQIVNGQLQTNAVFDFETKASYDIRVQTNDGNGGTFDQPFKINISNVNEAGEGTINGEVEEDSPLTVIVTDPDGISTGSSYQWQSSEDGNTWTDIPNATNENFTPGDDQVGQFIRVNVSLLKRLL